VRGAFWAGGRIGYGINTAATHLFGVSVSTMLVDAVWDAVHNEGAEDGFDTSIEGTSNPLTGEPDSDSTCNNKKGNKKQERHYGSDGFPEYDIDYDHAHGNGSNNSGSPHVHDWGRPADGSPPTHNDRGPGRPYTGG